MAATELVTFAVNIITLVAAMALFVRWLRNWLVKQIAEPVSDLTAKVKTIQDEIQSLEQRTTDAHHRIDNFLIGQSNA